MLLFFRASSLGKICPLRKSACSHRESVARRIGMRREGRRAGSRAGVESAARLLSQANQGSHGLASITFVIVLSRVGDNSVDKT